MWYGEVPLRHITFSDQWRFAEGVWIPKEENSKEIEQFRSIFLLSTESKIFFSILSRRLSKYLLKNNYIDTLVQKGGIPGFPGCLEHTGVFTQILREAREGKGDLAVCGWTSRMHTVPSHINW